MANRKARSVSDQETPDDTRGVGDGVIVFCAANNWDGIPLADHHMAKALARRAHVLFVDPPVSLAGDFPPRRPLRRSLQTVESQLLRYTPMMPPGGTRSPLLNLTERLVLSGLSRIIRRQELHPRAVISAWPLLNPFAAVPQGVPRIYWAQDDFVAISRYTGWSPRTVEQRELRIAAAADRLVASSPAVADHWASRGIEPALIPFGCPVAPTRQPPFDLGFPRPIAAFVGHINARIDVKILEAIADSPVTLLMIGPRASSHKDRAFDALLQRGNVHWIGPRPFPEIGHYLASVDVGIVPYDPHDRFNIGSFPLKTLEYLAAGLPVVSTDLPAIRWFESDLITIASGPTDFGRAVQASARVRHDEEGLLARRQLAAMHTWDKRIDQWIEVLGPGLRPSP